MERVDRYKCNCCGFIYETEREAKKCEDGHAMPEVIEEMHNWHGRGDKYTYPSVIRISMSNGTTRTYILSSVQE